uniref:Uncharacterized protein n=1 Tax=Solanum tuberosum TaxID=4113 RepID=M1D326_SOLTU
MGKYMCIPSMQYPRRLTKFCDVRGQWLQPPLETLLWDKDLKFKLKLATKTKGPLKKAYNLILSTQRLLRNLLISTSVPLIKFPW